MTPAEHRRGNHQRKKQTNNARRNNINNERTAGGRQAQARRGSPQLFWGMGDTTSASRWKIMRTEWFLSQRSQPGCFAHMRHRGLRCHYFVRPSTRSDLSQSTCVYSSESGYRARRRVAAKMPCFGEKKKQAATNFPATDSTKSHPKTN